MKRSEKNKVISVRPSISFYYTIINIKDNENLFGSLSLYNHTDFCSVQNRKTHLPLITFNQFTVLTYNTTEPKLTADIVTKKITNHH